MHPFHLILAQQDEAPGWVKALPAIIFFLLWILSAVASWWGKKQQQERRRRTQEEMEQSARQQPAPPPPPPPQDHTRRRPAASRPKRQTVKPTPPPLPIRVSRPAPQAIQPDVSEEGLVFRTQIGSGVEFPRTTRQAPPAAALLKGRINAGTIRSNYLIHEVLSPPVSLRERELGGWHV